MNIGDIHWIDLPVRGGHAQSGRRPGIIVQGTAASARLATTLFIPLTTQLDALRFPGTVLVETDATNGLRRASVALVFQLAAVDSRFIQEAIGHASDTTIDAIWAAFDVLTERQGTS